MGRISSRNKSLLITLLIAAIFVSSPFLISLENPDVEPPSKISHSQAEENIDVSVQYDWEGNWSKKVIVTANYLVTADSSNTKIRVFDISSGTLEWEYDTGVNFYFETTKDGEHLVVSKNQSILVFDIGDSTPIRTHLIANTSKTPAKLSISDDGNYVVAGTNSNIVEERKIMLFENSKTFPSWEFGHPGLNDLEISDNGNSIVATTGGEVHQHSVIYFSVDTSVPIWEYIPNDIGYSFWGLDLTEDGSRFVVGSGSKVLSFTSNNSEPLLLKCGFDGSGNYGICPPMHDYLISESGERIYSVAHNGTIHSFDSSNNVGNYSQFHPYQCAPVKIELRDSMIFSAGSYKPNLFENKAYGCVSLIDISIGVERTLFKHTEVNYQDISVDPYGIHFVASNSNLKLHKYTNPIMDADGDGLPYWADSCKGTEIGLPVNENGCSWGQLDNDQDGIINSEDICPEWEGESCAIPESLHLSERSIELGCRKEADNNIDCDGNQPPQEPSNAFLNSIYDAVQSIEYAPNGEIFAVGVRDSGVIVFNSSDGQIITFIDHGWNEELEFSNDGTILAVGGNANISLWNTSNWQQIGLIGEEGGNHINKISFSPDDKFLAYANTYPYVTRVIDLTDNSGGEGLFCHSRCAIVHNFTSPYNRIYSLDFSPDGSHFAISTQVDILGEFDVGLIVFETTNWSVEFTDAYGQITDPPEGWSQSYDNIRDLQFSTDNEWLITGSMRGDIRVYERSDWSIVGTFEIGMYGLQGIEISPDNSHVVSFTDYHSGPAVKILDLNSGNTDSYSSPCGDALSGSAGEIWSLSISPDGKNLLMGETYCLINNEVVKTVHSFEADSDNDGIVESFDICPNTNQGESVDSQGCSTNQVDSDEDGVYDSQDLCPDTASDVQVDQNGCALNQIDTDEDGISDATDQCANTPVNETVGITGCSTSEVDTDFDGIYDMFDNCPYTLENSTVDENGCAHGDQIDLDSDNDGVRDSSDDCESEQGGVVNETGCEEITESPASSIDDGMISGGSLTFLCCLSLLFVGFIIYTLWYYHEEMKPAFAWTPLIATTVILVILSLQDMPINNAIADDNASFECPDGTIVTYGESKEIRDEKGQSSAEEFIESPPAEWCDESLIWFEELTDEYFAIMLIVWASVLFIVCLLIFAADYYMSVTLISLNISIPNIKRTSFFSDNFWLGLLLVNLVVMFLLPIGPIESNVESVPGHDWIMQQSCDEEEVSECWKNDGIDDNTQYRQALGLLFVVGLILLVLGLVIVDKVDSGGGLFFGGLLLLASVWGLFWWLWGTIVLGLLEVFAGNPYWITSISVSVIALIGFFFSPDSNSLSNYAPNQISHPRSTKTSSSSSKTNKPSNQREKIDHDLIKQLVQQYSDNNAVLIEYEKITSNRPDQPKLSSLENAIRHRRGEYNKEQNAPYNRNLASQQKNNSSQKITYHNMTAVDLKLMYKAELVDLAKSANLLTSGTKAELIERIRSSKNWNETAKPTLASQGSSKSWARESSSVKQRAANIGEQMKAEKESELEKFLDMIGDRYPEMVGKISEEKILQNLISAERDDDDTWQTHFISMLWLNSIEFDLTSKYDDWINSEGSNGAFSVVLREPSAKTGGETTTGPMNMDTDILSGEKSIVPKITQPEFATDSNGIMTKRTSFSVVTINHIANRVEKVPTSESHNQMFRDEINVMKSLEYKGIDVGLLDYDLGEKPKIVTRYFGSHKLGEAIETASPRGKNNLITGLIEQVGKIHKAGWIHRDLKPDNIMVDIRPRDGNHRFDAIIDYGIAMKINRKQMDIHNTAGTKFFGHSSQKESDFNASTGQDWFSLARIIALIVRGSSIESLNAEIQMSQTGLDISKELRSLEFESEVADCLSKLVEESTNPRCDDLDTVGRLSVLGKQIVKLF